MRVYRIDTDVKIPRQARVCWMRSNQRSIAIPSFTRLSHVPENITVTSYGKVHDEGEVIAGEIEEYSDAYKNIIVQQKSDNRQF